VIIFHARRGWSVFGLSMGGVGLLLYLIRRGQVSRAASLIYLMPPTVALEAFIAFGEPLTLPLVVGTIVVVTGVYLTNRQSVAPLREQAQ
jgi:drug/metabolite transporter (DMT)-like permease